MQKLSRDAKLSLASVLVGVIGVLLAVIFYFRAQREREPFYFIQSTRNVIVNRDRSIGDKLSITYKGQPLDTTNVAALQVFFWNAGREPIKAADVLIPLRVVLDGGQLLDASISRQTRSLITKCQMLTIQTQSAEFICSNLEQNDGLTIQLVYSGDIGLNVHVDGAISESNINLLHRPMSEAEDSTANSSLKRQILLTAVFPLLMVALLGPIMLTITGIIFRWKNPTGYDSPIKVLKRYSKEVMFTRYTFVLIGAWAGISFGIYYWLFIRLPEIPKTLIGL